MNKCHERADQWADDALRRLSSSIDLVASDAIYHGQFESNFFTKKCIPITKGTETEHTLARRTDNTMRSNFEKLCKWLDGQAELFTLSELHAKNVFIYRKRSKCLLFKMDEKAVRTTLPEFNFFHR